MKFRIRTIIALIAAVVGFFIRKQVFGDQIQLQTNATISFVTIIVIFIVWGFFAGINKRLDPIIPFQRNFTKRIIIQSGLGVLFLIFLRSIIYFFVSHLVVVPEIIKNVPAPLVIGIDVFAALTVSLAVISHYLIERWKESLTRADRLEKRATQLQYSRLKEQVNPHFLFNTFSSLQGLIRTDPPLADEYIDHLARVYRYTLQNDDHTLVPLSDECGFLKDYINLLEIRYGQGLRIDLDVAEDKLHAFAIVFLSIQTLIDNAIKHNEIHSQRPLHIRIYILDRTLFVVNNYQLKETVASSNGHGMNHLKAVYQYFSEVPVYAVLDRNQWVVKLPLIEIEKIGR